MESYEDKICDMIVSYGFPFDNYEIFKYSNLTEPLDKSKNRSQLLHTGKLSLETFNNLLQIPHHILLSLISSHSFKRICGPIVSFILWKQLFSYLII